MFRIFFNGFRIFFNMFRIFLTGLNGFRIFFIFFSAQTLKYLNMFYIRMMYVIFTFLPYFFLIYFKFFWKFLISAKFFKIYRRYVLPPSSGIGKFWR